MSEPGRTRRVIGHALTRAVVPAWLLAGATYKLIESNPGYLPREMLEDASRFGIDLDLLLAVLIAIEFALVGAMVFLGRYAKFVAMFILTVFCIVLLREIIAGNTKCGCFGGKSPSPWVMFGIDAGLLVLVTWLGVRTRTMPRPAAWIAFAVFALVGAALCWFKILS